jgi:non-heme chloroperoxidase
MNRSMAMLADTQNGAAAPRGDRIVRARDGAALYVKDWGAGPPVLFVHSWAINADMWEYQMTPLAEQGRRVIAFDRRGHGRSQETAAGYDIDNLADDLGAVIEALDLTDLTLVGHSMGGPEAVRYLSRHGAGRVARLALVAPTTPRLRQSPDNPGGVPQAAFDQMRASWRQDRAKWLADNSRPFLAPETSQAMVDWLIGLMMQTSLKVWLDCNDTVVAGDFRRDLAALRLPVQVIHGDADVSAPLALTGQPTAALVPGARLIVYEGAPHGLFITHAERLNADLAAFVAG